MSTIRQDIVKIWVKLLTQIDGTIEVRDGSGIGIGIIVLPVSGILHYLL